MATVVHQALRVQTRPESRRTFVESCIDLYLKGNLANSDGSAGGPGSLAGVWSLDGDDE